MTQIIIAPKFKINNFKKITLPITISGNDLSDSYAADFISGLMPIKFQKYFPEFRVRLERYYVSRYLALFAHGPTVWDRSASRHCLNNSAAISRYYSIVDVDIIRNFFAIRRLVNNSVNYLTLWNSFRM